MLKSPKQRHDFCLKNPWAAFVQRPRWKFVCNWFANLQLDLQNTFHYCFNPNKYLAKLLNCLTLPFYWQNIFAKLQFQPFWYKGFKPFFEFWKLLKIVIKIVLHLAFNPIILIVVFLVFLHWSKSFLLGYVYATQLSVNSTS